MKWSYFKASFGVIVHHHYHITLLLSEVNGCKAIARMSKLGYALAARVAVEINQ
jgi:hypothetical protein